MSAISTEHPDMPTKGRKARAAEKPNALAEMSEAASGAGH